jgi:hypothetical protein
MEQMNVKLAEVVSEITGLTGMRIISTGRQAVLGRRRGGGVHGEFGCSAIGDSRQNPHDPQVCNPRCATGGDMEVKK